MEESYRNQIHEDKQLQLSKVNEGVFESLLVKIYK